MTEETYTYVEESVRTYANLKYTENQAQEARKRQGKETLELLQENGRSKVTISFDDEQDVAVAVKVRQNNRIDEDRLKKALGAKVYNKLTTPILDESKIEAAIRLGEVDPNIVESCIETLETPYLEARFTKKRKRRS